MTETAPPRRTVLCIVGTRPEAIKMAPVVLSLRREPWARVRVLATAQHREMLDQVLEIFDIRPDVDLDIMQADQKLPELTARLVTALDDSLARENPDVVLAQGDTTTVLAAALASFYRRIPFAHVEAGLRTLDRNYPFPEEMNRALAGQLALLHFAPTETSRRNLLREGIPSSSIHVTGNTVIDALLHVAAQEIPVGVDLDAGKRLVLVTAHRRENFGAGLLDICRALRALADGHPDVQVLYCVHPNPNVSRPVRRELQGHPRILLCPPLHYGPFVSAMKRSYLILTDSGGVQEEAPALGKPVLVLRAETERPEAVAEGVARLVGTSSERILAEARRLLDDPAAYAAMARGASPYGDGRAAERIVSVLRQSHALPLAHG
jgi:UDP-N-acetylglucosamine 2-epimerase (non-hydrolysing)